MTNYPPELLRRRLAFHKRAGWPFEKAWTRSLYTGIVADDTLPALRWANGADFAEWREAFEATREEWELAYCGEPSGRATAPFLRLAEFDPDDLKPERDPPPAPAYVAPIRW